MRHSARDSLLAAAVTGLRRIRRSGDNMADVAAMVFGQEVCRGVGGGGVMWRVY